MSLFLLSLLACDPKVSVDDTAAVDDTDADTDTDTDTDADADTDTDTDVEPAVDWHILLSTTDYTTGALSQIAADGTLTDGFLPISSDTAVRADNGHVYLLQRSSENTLSMYQPGSYDAPEVEFSTGDGSNPTGAAMCDGKILVSRQLTGDIAAYDPTTGFAVGTIDLSDWADDDGSAEPDAIFVSPNGSAYVTLLQLDYINTYASVDGTGTLLKIDCTDLSVTDEWEVGPNPNLTRDAVDLNGFYLSGGDYYLPDYSGPELDGGVWHFDTATDTLSDSLTTEEGLGKNIGGIYTRADGFGLTTLDDGYRWTIGCINLTDWTITSVEIGNVFVPSITGDPEGGVWVAQAAGFDYTDTDTSDDQIGITRWDPATCASSTVVRTALLPSSLETVIVPSE